MNASAGATISPAELDRLLDSSSPPRVLDVRTPAEYETAHIAGSHNVPLDVLRARRSEIAEQLKQVEVVLVCKSGQRAAKAGGLLRDAGLPSGRVLENGITGWQGEGRAVDRGRQRWELERQVRLVAGSIVLSSVIGSVALPKLKWLAAAIGGGLTFAAVSDTCAMASALSRLPYNRGADTDADSVVAKLGGGASVA